MDTIDTPILRACQVQEGALSKLKDITDAICRTTKLTKSEAISDLAKAGFQIHRVGNQLFITGLVPAVSR
jgi:hypothetical protein